MTAPEPILIIATTGEDFRYYCSVLEIEPRKARIIQRVESIQGFNSGTLYIPKFPRGIMELEDIKEYARQHKIKIANLEV